MTTEQKNALAKKYSRALTRGQLNMVASKYAKAGEFYHIRRSGFLTGYEARDKEVNDLVEALRKARKDHIDHRTLSEGVALDSSYAQGVIAHNEFVDDLDELLSKYPVNKEGNG